MVAATMAARAAMVAERPATVADRADIMAGRPRRKACQNNPVSDRRILRSIGPVPEPPGCTGHRFVGLTRTFWVLLGPRDGRSGDPRSQDFCTRDPFFPLVSKND